MNIIEHKITKVKDNNLALYFHFSQNNSGGSFDIDENVARHVIIQAHSVREAHRIASDVGIYFNGCDSGQDCSCCGDRWSEIWSDSDGTSTPLIYGEDPEKYDDMFTRANQPICHVYKLDGTKITYRKKSNK